LSSATSASSVEMRCCMDCEESAVVSGEFGGLVCAFADAARTIMRTNAVFNVLLARVCESTLVRMSGCEVLFLTTSSRRLAVLRESEEALTCEPAYAEAHKETDRFR
jgi:hypothetical protein